VTQVGQFVVLDGSCALPSDGSEFREVVSDWFLNQATTESIYGPIESWNTAFVTDMSFAFSNRASFDSEIGSWNTGNVTNVSFIFSGASTFNQNISVWDTSKVQDMTSAFENAISFDGDLGRWDTGSVRSMSSMFSGALSFNQSLDNWDTIQVAHMNSMFAGASSFNNDITSWNTENVQDTSSMFGNALSFNQGIGSWNTGRVNSMNSMFSGASSFNQDISAWDTSWVSQMGSLFKDATRFNQNIANWDTSRVVDMSSMFQAASSFDQNIGGWNTSSVRDMRMIFSGPSSFNQDISGWDVRNVQDYSGMFDPPSSFNQNLCAWNDNANAANTLPSSADPCPEPTANPTTPSSQVLPLSLVVGAAAGGGVALLALVAALYGVRRRTRDENKLIGQLLRRQDFTGFISHYKGEAGPSARILKSTMSEKLSGGGVPFLDSDNLTDLGKLLKELRSSKTLVAILSTNYLRRPFCLAELAEACRVGMAIISVRLVGVHEFVHESDFQEIAIVDEASVQRLLNREEWKMLEEEGIALSDVAAGIKRLKQIIALPFSPNGSSKIQSAEVDEIILQMHEKTKESKDHPSAVALEDKI